jgi:hypothetical protein
LAEFPVLGRDTGEIFSRIDIYNVGQMLRADAQQIARDLNLPQVTPETVGLWQTHMELMCGVPGLSLNDAQVLTACGIHSSRQLRDTDPEHLQTQMQQFLQSARGARFASHKDRYQLSRLREWISAVPASTIRRKPVRSETSQSSAHLHGKSGTSPHGNRFFLGRDDAVEEAPSIGPRMANYLAQAGIHTVGDLLAANPKSVAATLDLKGLTANKVTQWQRQARLQCQIPDLRGTGAQLLVAAGFASPEQIAAVPGDELVQKLQTFCATPTGKRILRDAELPSAAKIKRWAASAAEQRPLEAA